MPNKTNLISKEKTQKQNRIWVRISSACNNKCVFCLDSEAHNGTFQKEDEVKKQIKNGFKSGYENRIIISGGEASINPKFVDYIKYSREIGYNRIQTVTNGNMFANEDFCKKVFDAGLEEVTFSFHGHNEKLHDFLVATPGAFKKSLKGLINIKKNYPNIILNVDVVVNKINVKFLPEIIKFFIKLGIYEFDILQIIPFGRGFSENKNILFYDIEENLKYLHDTWKLSNIPGMYMWTNRFPSEAFEGFEDLIQDPRKISGEVMGESFSMYEPFIKSNGKIKPECYGEKCNYCFLNQYCNDFINKPHPTPLLTGEGIKKNNFYILSGEEFPSKIYEKYGNTFNDFKQKIKSIKFPSTFGRGVRGEGIEIINLPKCLNGSGIYQKYNDIKEELSLQDYTQKYIKNLYRKKSLRCKNCKYNSECEGIHINFIRSYGFDILQPIIK